MLAHELGHMRLGSSSTAFYRTMPDGGVSTAARAWREAMKSDARHVRDAFAGVELLDFTTPWSAVVDRELPLVVHDPLCPGTSVEFLRAAVDAAIGSGAVVAGVRPVTDTVKVVADGSA